ncbi:hypothetical protein P3S67_005529 [Capsicum chacoense]
MLHGSSVPIQNMEAFYLLRFWIDKIPGRKYRDSSQYGLVLQVLGNLRDVDFRLLSTSQCKLITKARKKRKSKDVNSSRVDS